MTTLRHEMMIMAKEKPILKSLRVMFPALVLSHATVPLTVVQTGPRAWIKSVIGRKIGGYENNIIRNKFNDFMRNTYGGSEPLFDLALPISPCLTPPVRSAAKSVFTKTDATIRRWRLNLPATANI